MVVNVKKNGIFGTVVVTVVEGRRIKDSTFFHDTVNSEGNVKQKIHLMVKYTILSIKATL